MLNFIMHAIAQLIAQLSQSQPQSPTHIRVQPSLNGVLVLGWKDAQDWGLAELAECDRALCVFACLF